jgi:hypothetical protein
MRATVSWCISSLEVGAVVRNNPEARNLIVDGGPERLGEHQICAVPHNAHWQFAGTLQCKGRTEGHRRLGP